MELTPLERIGHLTQSTNSNNLIDYFKSRCNELGIKYLFDVSNYGNPSILTICEFLSKKGGVYISPVDYDTTMEITSYSWRTGKLPIDPTKFISRDKYDMIPWTGECYDAVSILPGSNYLYESIDHEKLYDMTRRYNYIIKPHPITTIGGLEDLSKYNRCSSLFSAYDLVDCSNKVFLSGTSELFVYVLLNGKELYSISPDNVQYGGGYTEMFEFIIDKPNKVDCLLRILNNPLSGVCFSEEDVDSYLMNFKEKYL